MPSTTRDGSVPPRHANRLLVGAATVGLVHAAFSLYWALGGRWLLDTVGQWAVRLAQEQPLVAGFGLTAVALLKAAGAVIPLLVESRTDRTGARRAWRTVEWAGAVVLFVYGLANIVVASAVLTGVISAPGGYDRAAQLGHALLWDPLFLLWGLLLGLGLWATRRGGPPDDRIAGVDADRLD